MKTKNDFQALDFADIVFGFEEPSKIDQQAFSNFLKERKKDAIARTKQQSLHVRKVSIRV